MHVLGSHQLYRCERTDPPSLQEPILQVSRDGRRIPRIVNALRAIMAYTDRILSLNAANTGYAVSVCHGWMYQTFFSHPINFQRVLLLVVTWLEVPSLPQKSREEGVSSMTKSLKSGASKHTKRLARRGAEGSSPEKFISSTTRT